MICARPGCGTVFCPDADGTMYYLPERPRVRLYCSKSCWETGPDARSAEAAAKARADKRDLILAVYERDGWQCRMPECLCPGGRAVDPALRDPDPWSPTIDHIIQQSAGGGDDADNLRTAHKRCNATGAQPYDRRGSRWS
jgi:hypothetical protein